MDSETSNACRDGAQLQQPVIRQPASRWQQLKHSINGSGNTALQDGLTGVSAVSEHSTQQRSSNRLCEHGAAQAVHQEAADVLRRCADTGAALQAQDVQMVAALLATSCHTSSRNQFNIGLDGSISCQSSPVGQLAETSLLHGLGGVDWDSSAGIRDLYGLIDHDIPNGTAPALQFNSQPATTNSLPPGRSPVSKQRHQATLSQQGLLQRQQAWLPPQQPDRLPSCGVDQPRKLARQCSSTDHGCIQVPASSSRNVVHNSNAARSSQQLLRRNLGPPKCRHSIGNIAASHSGSKQSRVTDTLPTSLILPPSLAEPAAADGCGYRSQDLGLAHDLAAMLARKFLCRWQQCTVNMQLEKARARPMQKLLRSVGSLTQGLKHAFSFGTVAVGACMSLFVCPCISGIMHYEQSFMNGFTMLLVEAHPDLLLAAAAFVHKQQAQDAACMEGIDLATTGTNSTANSSRSSSSLCCPAACAGCKRYRSAVSHAASPAAAVVEA